MRQLQRSKSATRVQASLIANIGVSLVSLRFEISRSFGAANSRRPLPLQAKSIYPNGCVVTTAAESRLEGYIQYLCEHLLGVHLPTLDKWRHRKLGAAELSRPTSGGPN